MSQVFLIVAVPFYCCGAYWDYKARIIPDIVPASLAMIAILHYVIGGEQGISLCERLLGVMIPAIVLFILYLIMPNGLGGGDYKLIIASGALIGLSDLTGLLLLASIMSLFYCVVKKTRAVPFAVPMSIGYFISVCTFLGGWS